MTQKDEAKIKQMAERYAEPGARWLPGLPIRGDNIGKMLYEAFVAGAHFARQD